MMTKTKIPLWAWIAWISVTLILWLISTLFVVDLYYQLCLALLAGGTINIILTCTTEKDADKKHLGVSINFVGILTGGFLFLGKVWGFPFSISVVLFMISSVVFFNWLDRDSKIVKKMKKKHLLFISLAATVAAYVILIILIIMGNPARIVFVKIWK